jgi:cell division protein FtsB
MYRLLLPISAGLLLLYTTLQLINGERGVVTWKHLTVQVQQLQAENADLHAYIDQLQRNVVRLRPDAHQRLDEDYVDEEIRRHLPLVKAGERVILVSASSF